MSSRKFSEELIDGVIFLEQPELAGWFRLAFKVDRVLLRRRTDFQDLAVVEAGPLGRVLLLDRSIQTTTFDEAAYHEMLVHVPMLSHPDPRRVLIIGGGDGGAVREVLKHPQVERVDLCEIDSQVIQASQQYLPGLAAGLDDPRVHVHISDGVEFVAGRRESYEVILVDSSDPEGPAEVLFSRGFYAELSQALSPGGIICSQAESFYLYGPLIKRLLGHMADIFPRVHYYLALVPTYLSGIIGFALGSQGPDPLARPDPARLEALGPLRYYTPAAARAAFALPQPGLDLLPPASRARQQEL